MGSAPAVFLNLGCRTNAAEIDELAQPFAGVTGAVVVNSCTVTAAADRDTRHAVARARREHPGAAVVVLGCYVDAHPGDDLGADLLVPNALKPVPVLGGTTAVDPPGARRSRFVLKIQDGCDNRCTFCIVWQTRGRSISRVLPVLEARARSAAEAGYREIVLTGIDLGSYRGGLNAALERLLAAAAPARIRLSSIDPAHVTPALARMFEHLRLCPHLHLPLQSGSEPVLARMRRRYDLAGFRRAVELVRSVRPDLALTGDLMVGFPGETEADFAATMAEVERAEFMDLHVFRWSPRPRTAAARYEGHVPLETGRRRSAALIELGRRLGEEFRQNLEGRRLGVVWDRVDGDRIRGLSEYYVRVGAPAEGRRPGGFEEVTWRTASSAA